MRSEKAEEDIVNRKRVLYSFFRPLCQWIHDERKFFTNIEIQKYKLLVGSKTKRNNLERFKKLDTARGILEKRGTFH